MGRVYQSVEAALERLLTHFRLGYLFRPTAPTGEHRLVMVCADFLPRRGVWSMSLTPLSQRRSLYETAMSVTGAS